MAEVTPTGKSPGSNPITPSERTYADNIALYRNLATLTDAQRNTFFQKHPEVQSVYNDIAETERIKFLPEDKRKRLKYLEQGSTKPSLEENVPASFVQESGFSLPRFMAYNLGRSAPDIVKKLEQERPDQEFLFNESGRIYAKPKGSSESWKPIDPEQSILSPVESAKTYAKYPGELLRDIADVTPGNLASAGKYLAATAAAIPSLAAGPGAATAAFAGTYGGLSGVQEALKQKLAQMTDYSAEGPSIGSVAGPAAIETALATAFRAFPKEVFLDKSGQINPHLYGKMEDLLRKKYNLSASQLKLKTPDELAQMMADTQKGLGIKLAELPGKIIQGSTSKITGASPEAVANYFETPGMGFSPLAPAKEVPEGDTKSLLAKLIDPFRSKDLATTTEEKTALYNKIREAGKDLYSTAQGESNQRFEDIANEAVKNSPSGAINTKGVIDLIANEYQNQKYNLANTTKTRLKNRIKDNLTFLEDTAANYLNQNQWKMGMDFTNGSSKITDEERRRIAKALQTGIYDIANAGDVVGPINYKGLTYNYTLKKPVSLTPSQAMKQGLFEATPAELKGARDVLKEEAENNISFLNSKKDYNVSFAKRMLGDLGKTLEPQMPGYSQEMSNFAKIHQAKRPFLAAMDMEESGKTSPESVSRLSKKLLDGNLNQLSALQGLADLANIPTKEGASQMIGPYREMESGLKKLAASNIENDLYANPSLARTNPWSTFVSWFRNPYVLKAGEVGTKAANLIPKTLGTTGYALPYDIYQSTQPLSLESEDPRTIESNRLYNEWLKTMDKGR